MQNQTVYLVTTCSCDGGCQKVFAAFSCAEAANELACRCYGLVQELQLDVKYDDIYYWQANLDQSEGRNYGAISFPSETISRPELDLPNSARGFGRTMKEAKFKAEQAIGMNNACT